MHYVRVAPSKIFREDSSELIYHSDQRLSDGQVVKVPLGASLSFGVVLGSIKTKPKFKTKAVAEATGQALPKALVETLQWMSSYYATPLPLVVKNALPTGLAKRRRPATESSFDLKRPIAGYRPTPQQAKAVRRILSAKSTVLLHGDTASGKTVVYRQAIQAALAQGKSALLLVPEIGLTPQAIADYQDLTGNLFVTHSALSEAKRHLVWQAIAQTNEPMLVIGPRSALFMPAVNLGLIIVDEAHENSYKQDVSPRYQAQTVAAYLAHRHSAKLVLGSATPRISDYYLAKSRKTPILTMPTYHQRQRRQIELIDKADKDQFKRSQYLSDALIASVDSALKSAKQALLYLNRRGTATVGLCVNCGWTATCPRCDSQLTLHQDLGQLRCHLCGWHGHIPLACPECRQPDIAYRGAGTKRIEAEARKLWPSARIARFDTDSALHARLADLYHDLHDGRIDIAVGTQMLSRGLDLPHLDVVGVVSADSELYLPDFSASERTFQLLYQVMGRAGRAGGGRVVVQAWQPEHPAIKLALAGDYGRFYDYEYASRQRHGYPPLTHVLSIIGSFASRQQAATKTLAAKQRLSQHYRLSTVGPSPAFYEKQSRRWRWQIVAKSAKRQSLLQAAADFRQQGWQIDLDPISLLY